jgi:hypothetical protein
MRPALALLFLSAWISTYGWTFPDRYNKILAPGDKAPSWSNLPGTDGKPHSLAEFKDKQVLVVIFLCCSCPAVEDYEERILDFATMKSASSTLPKNIAAPIPKSAWSGSM